MTISHLGSEGADGLVGPTAFFKVSNVVTSQNIPNHGASTKHIPELNLHGFGTRLGHRVGRMLGSLFPHDAEFQGRQVVTFHNQRDYIFIRHHRYIFEEKKLKEEKKQKKKADKKEAEKPLTLKDRVKARLQELGPRFTLKLRWLQSGTFDTQFGEYEWIHKRKEMDTTRRRFHL
jgi:ribosome production factor 1